MQTGTMVIVNEFCIHHNIDISFIHALQESGLIETTVAGEKLYLHEDQLPRLEKIVRLFYEMDINLEGIETITYLLSQMHQMQAEIIHLKNRLALYEEGQL